MQKGFTLVELLAVIVILAIISAITFISVGSVIKNSKKTLSDVQIDNIVQAAKTYYLKEGMIEENIDNDETETCVNLNYLIESGYIDDSEVINLINEEQLQPSVKIIYSNNKYKYTYQEKSCEIEYKTTNDSTSP